MQKKNYKSAAKPIEQTKHNDTHTLSQGMMGNAS